MLVRYGKAQRPRWKGFFSIKRPWILHLTIKNWSSQRDEEGRSKGEEEEEEEEEARPAPRGAMAMAMAMSGEYMACAALAMESTITTPAFSIPCRASFLASKRVAIQEHAVFPNHRSIIYPCSNLQHPFRRGPYSAASFAASFPTPFEEVEVDRESVPKPIVVIDQDSDPHATVVELGFGDRLGALLDTVGALKELGLNVVKGTVSSSSLAPNKFSITRADTGRKVENPELLETIRLTIINNLLQYHPESSEQLAMGEAFGIKPPKEKLDVNVATHITIKRDGPKRRGW
ncbi:hypothetical protein O6H91_02G047200 [Diphasiastrum complanatum]|uniref:Uncharacterized protein n=1 Tax=Diphasiastrum complanatum TaxID=34168 RepID=A0ACC2EF25_DIPCM|nr:hypothetical protein O6H91_02G047200 [Diphasiastrum complanatum]